MDCEPCPHQSLYRDVVSSSDPCSIPNWGAIPAIDQITGSFCDPCRLSTVYIIDAIEIITELTAFCVIVGRGYHK
jgi:hypothetical protein